ncbi:hypothetical protein RPHASCH2410_CH08415 [Rhizobium phaseoli Ch24-10]|nr:hypothetical protein RPHASCH2410_CH08415 [Rhizobium phaseoli Ch24-10]
MFSGARLSRGNRR